MSALPLKTFEHSVLEAAQAVKGGVCGTSDPASVELVEWLHWRTSEGWTEARYPYATYERLVRDLAQEALWLWDGQQERLGA